MAAGNLSSVQYGRHKVALLYIRSTRYYLYSLRSHIYLTYNKLVGIGVPLDLLDLSDYYLL